MVDLKEYPYLATWANSIEEANHRNEIGSDGWVHWNGISMTWPKFIQYQGQTYTFEEFKKRFWDK